MASERPRDHLVWERAEVDGRPTVYGTGGEGLPAVFLHAWGLGQHAYKRTLKRLVHLGCRVYAPALPGFGGTADLPDEHFSLPGYAAWVDRFLDAVGVTEPALVMGHSFGGGVAIQLAHDFHARVRTLVLINSIGGSAWTPDQSTIRSMVERPLWDWGIHFPSDILPFPHVTRVLPVIFEDVVSNLLRNPRAFWRVAGLARRADLTGELEGLKRRGLPVVVLWGESDRIIPKASFDALCAALGSEGEVVPGNHSWLLADPESFGEVMTNVVPVAQLAESLEGAEPPTRRRGRLGLARGRRTRRLPSVAGARPTDETEAAAASD